MTGIMISSTSDLTIAVKAPPTATPMARSTTLPRLMNSRNSFTKGVSEIALRGLVVFDFLVGWELLVVVISVL